MDAIKTKYDRVLLGTFAVLALALGGLVIVKAGDVKKQFTPVVQGKKNAELGGKELEEKVAQTLEALKTEVERTPKVLGPNKTAELFVSVPVVKTATGETINLLDDQSPPVRPPIDNAWLYKHELDITRDDIAQIDTDGDGYTNLEEFEGKSNPRSRSSMPEWYTKMRYKECLKDPLSLKFTIYDDLSGELQIQRVEPAPKRTDFVKVGQVLQRAAPRFKLVRLDRREKTTGGSSSLAPVAILQDLQDTAAPPLEIMLGETVQRPKLTALLVDGLSGKEFKVVQGQEFEIPKVPGMKILVTSVTEETVGLSFISPGKTERQEITLKL